MKAGPFRNPENHDSGKTTSPMNAPNTHAVTHSIGLGFSSRKGSFFMVDSLLVYDDLMLVGASNRKARD